MTLGFVEDRKIKYLQTHSSSWEKHLPNRKWVALILNHDISLSALYAIYKTCKAQNPLSVCLLADSKINLTTKSEEEYASLIIDFIQNNQLEAMDQYFELGRNDFFENETEAFHYASKIAGLDFNNLQKDPGSITVVCLETNKDKSLLSLIQELIASNK